MPYFLYGKDLVDGLTGPFDTIEAAVTYLVVCIDRGYADPGRVVNGFEAYLLRNKPGGVGTEVTPEEDTAIWMKSQRQ